MIIVQIAEIGKCLRNLIRNFRNYYARCGQQFPSQHLGSLHVESVVDALIWNSMWHNDGDGLVGLSARKDLINVVQ